MNRSLETTTVGSMLRSPRSRISARAAAHLVVGLGAMPGPLGVPPEEEDDEEAGREGHRQGGHQSGDHGAAATQPPSPLGEGDPSRRDRAAFEPSYQVVRKGPRGRLAPARVLLEAGQAEDLEVARDPEIEPARRHRFLRLDASDRLGAGIGQERGTAGEQLVEDHSHRVDVGGGTQGRTSAAELLGRHVQQRALSRAGAGGGRVVAGAGDPEVGELERGAVQGRPRRGVDQDVGRLEVEVRDTGEVELLQGTGDGHQQRRGVAGRQRAGQPFLQAAAREVLQHEVGPAAGLVHPVELDDVGMAAPRGCARLLQPAFAVARGGEGTDREELDRDLPVRMKLPRQEDHPHAAPAQLATPS